MWSGLLQALMWIVEGYTLCGAGETLDVFGDSCVPLW